MGRCYTEGTSNGLRPAYFLLVGIAAVFWLVLIAGVSAVQHRLGAPTRPIQGLPWFIIWFQFVILLALLPIKVTIISQGSLDAILSSFSTDLCLLPMSTQPCEGQTSVSIVPSAETCTSSDVARKAWVSSGLHIFGFLPIDGIASGPRTAKKKLAAFMKRLSRYEVVKL